MCFRTWFLFPTLIFILLCSGAFAGGTTVSGTVSISNGEPAPGARVSLIELERSVFTDEAGAYDFDDVPAGAYHLSVHSDRFGGAVAEIDVAREALRQDLVLDRSTHREKIVVTASPTGRGSGEIVQPVAVVDKTALLEKAQPTIGETLSREAGVSSTYYGPGASRPVIRGQGAARVRVLEGGLDVGDASSTSPDHAIASDPIAAERIEIVRGPATLLYGSTAVGGVVNIIDQRIPDHAPHKPFGADVNLRLGSVAEERSGTAVLDGGVAAFAWHVDALKRKTGDYDIPGNRVLDDPSSASGTLPNSSIESDGATLGMSWVGKRSYVGVSARRFDTLYGTTLIEEGERPIRIDMQQRRYDLRGRSAIDAGRLDGVHYRIGLSDYKHTELAGGEVGTRFTNESVDSRVELHHGKGTPFAGVFGVQYTDRELRAEGDEAFIPPSQTGVFSLFLLQELGQGPVRFEVGGRYENSRHTVEVPADPLPDQCVAPRDRSFEGLSGSAGMAWLPNPRYAVGLSLSATQRLPNAEELYSCGEHAATRTFEIGDPELGKERGLGLDLSLRRRTGRVSGELTLFVNDYSGYIFESPDGTTIDELPVFRFEQVDARFSGLELNGTIALLHRDAQDLDLEFRGDYVNGSNETGGGDLPYITPPRAGVGLRYRGSSWYASAHVFSVADQDRVVLSDFDVATDQTAGYTTVDAVVGYRLVRHGLLHDIMLRGTNVTDTEARNHVSRLRDVTPLPGADVSLSYRLVF